MTDFTPELPEPQPLAFHLKRVLLQCADMADTPGNTKAMILTMYESGLLTPAETFAHIASRGLESA